jgi:beta-lactamase class D
MNKKTEYVFTISPERLRLFKRLTPEERFLWLEEAQEFVKNALSEEKLKKWMLYKKGGIEDGKGKV